MSDRLTDEKWRGLLNSYSDQAPTLPSWTSTYIAD